MSFLSDLEDREASKAYKASNFDSEVQLNRTAATALHPAVTRSKSKDNANYKHSSIPYQRSNSKGRKTPSASRSGSFSEIS